MEESHKVEAKNHGGLDDWFKKEKWVRVDVPKKKGKFQPCGRGDTSKGKKPVCVPVNKAKNLTEKERKNRVRQKRNKEKEPNPDKKPNVTTYSPGAGGKSNVSNTQNINFVGSVIPLSDLRSKYAKFLRIALMGEEDEIATTDISGMFSDIDEKILVMTEDIQRLAFSELATVLRHQMELTGPEGFVMPSVRFYENPVLEEFTEQEYLAFVKHKRHVLRNLYQKAVEEKNDKMHEIFHKMYTKSVNPFNYAEIAEIVREVLNK